MRAREREVVTHVMGVCMKCMHSNYKEKRQKDELNEKVYEDKVGKEDKRMRRKRRRSNLKELF